MTGVSAVWGALGGGVHWDGGGAEGFAGSGAAGTAVCSVRKSFTLRCTEQPADGEGLQDLIFPSLGFYQV